jgi:hypothetical protein
VARTTDFQATPRFAPDSGAAHRLLPHSVVLVMRCAWHPKYRGYPWIYSISSWRGRDLVVSDGMCRSCARHWRDEFRAGHPFSSVAPPLVPAWMPRLGVALALTTAVLLAARPLDPATAGRAASPGDPADTSVAAGPPSASPWTGRDDCPSPTQARQTIRRSAVVKASAEDRSGVRRIAAVPRDVRPASMAWPCRAQSVSGSGMVAAPASDCSMRVAAATLATRSLQSIALAQAP